MAEPIWLTRQVVQILHHEQIAEHGGRAGLRDENGLEASLARPRQQFAYGEATTLPDLAATLCIGIARNRPFVDGNKRVALLATYTFLALNGCLLDADEIEAAEIIESVATGAIGEAELAVWVGEHLDPTVRRMSP